MNRPPLGGIGQNITPWDDISSNILSNCLSGVPIRWNISSAFACFDGFPFVWLLKKHSDAP